jgi:CSLREA domain-containing protein
MSFNTRPRSGRHRFVIGLVLCMLIIGTLVPSAPVRAAGFVVNSTSDSVDVNPGDGICATSSGVCTLRAAVQEANTLPGTDTITIPAGVYTLRIASGAADEQFGDFDITGPVTIVGAGAGATILDGGDPPIGSPPTVLALDRLFEIHPTAGNVTIRNLTVREGYSPDSGGGIANATPGTLRLESVTVTGNISDVEGGGIFHDVGRLVVTGTVAAPSVISNNRARGGGGIHSTGLMSPVFVPTRVEVSRTTFSGNSASAAGGAIEVVSEGTLSVADSSFSGNSTAGDGGGISASSKSSLSVTRSSFANNSAEGSGGGISSATEGSASISGSTFSGNQAGGVDASGVLTDGEGGGLYAGGMGSVQITGSAFTGNSATGNGGGIAIDNGGTVGLLDSTVHDNSSQAGGGGIFNAGYTVVFERVQATGNSAVGDGGGLLSEATGNFTIDSSSFNGNSAENGGGFANAGDGGLRVTRTTFWNNRALTGVNSDTGLGGGIYSLGDAAAEYSNVTISGNLAQVRGGGLYVDADAGVRVINSTITQNRAPAASGVGDEGTAQPTNPPTPSLSVIFRNTIVGANLGSEQCNYALGSEGGNISTDDSCYFRGERDRSRIANLGLDAIADNGGPVLTHALQAPSIAVDNAVTPCATTDARGVARPLNLRCDSGAYEYEGPFDPADTEAPETIFISGPVQDTPETSLFTFSGTDNVTAPGDLIYQCRLLEIDPTEPPEPVDPTQPIDPLLDFLPCANPHQVPLIEAGFYLFEVRAIDRAGNVDPTPVSRQIALSEDLTPPQTTIVSGPPNPSGSTVSFTFSGSDNATPAQFLEFECRLNSNDPADWLECFSPAVYANLTPGPNTFQVRALDGGDNLDPSPASFSWTVGGPASCDAANITLTAVEDTYIDEGLPLDNYGLFEGLTVRSQAGGNDARTLVRFVIPAALPDCQLESATLRLFSEADPGRTLEADLIAGPWQELQATWANQPATLGQPVITTSGAGYRSWNVTAHVLRLLGGSANYGWMLRDAEEEFIDGAESGFNSAEAITEPTGGGGG